MVFNPVKNMQHNHSNTQLLFLFSLFLSCVHTVMHTLSLTHMFTHWHFVAHTLPNSVSPDGWECFRWQFSPATSVVRHHLSAKPVMEERERNTISPYLTLLHSPRFHSLFFRLRVPTRPALPVFSTNVISLFHTFICFCFFLSAVIFFVHFGDLMS